MDLMARKQYLENLQQEYSQSSKNGKTKILDEYIKNTGHNRKYIISRFNDPNLLSSPSQVKKKRKSFYDSVAIGALETIWEIFDYPCGQRLKPILITEVERLRQFKEIIISDDVAAKLKKISPATIDRKLKDKKKHLKKFHFSTTRPGSLLKRKIAVRLTEWDTSRVGYLEADLVAHCGSSAAGQYINTLSLTEISSGWWEGQAIMGKGQSATLEALKKLRARTPFDWRGLDSDNGGEFINTPLWKYCIEEKIEFTRSREYHKNDNAYVEQKNWTHVRKIFGYQRYDTPQELAIINDLYDNELWFYKNFFQPVMKLFIKKRIGGKVTRKYLPPESPLKRVLQSEQVSIEEKQKLRDLYQILNPAQLKRAIDQKLDVLQQAYLNKHKLSDISSRRKEVAMVRF
jgi:hypothetical protein